MGHIWSNCTLPLNFIRDELKQEVKQLKKEIRESKKRTEKMQVKQEEPETPTDQTGKHF